MCGGGIPPSSLWRGHPGPWGEPLLAARRDRIANPRWYGFVRAAHGRDRDLFLTTSRVDVSRETRAAERRTSHDGGGLTRPLTCPQRRHVPQSSDQPGRGRTLSLDSEQHTSPPGGQRHQAIVVAARHRILRRVLVAESSPHRPRGLRSPHDRPRSRCPYRTPTRSLSRDGNLPSTLHPPPPHDSWRRSRPWPHRGQPPRLPRRVRQRSATRSPPRHLALGDRRRA